VESNRDSILTEMLRHIGSKRPTFNVHPSRVLVFAHIHCLPSYSRLLAYMIKEVGFDPSRMVVIPKAYSTIPKTLDEIDALGIRVERTEIAIKIGYYDKCAAPALKAACNYASRYINNQHPADGAILLDDGGFLTEFWHKCHLHEKLYTISVQQTTSGICREPSRCQKIVKINVAGSAAKRWFESGVIAAGITRKLSKLQHQLANRRVGIIGYGAIGRAIANAMTKYTNEICIYDSAPNVRAELFKNASSIGGLIDSSDFIFGCTGEDPFLETEHVLRRAKNSITFVSCSSRDVEFRALLKAYAQPASNSLGDITLLADNVHKVLNGGFPINFDRLDECETESEISLTRALTLSGVLQGLRQFKSTDSENILVALGHEAQKLAVETWLGLNNKSCELFGVSETDFADETWWETESVHQAKDRRIE
jgi:S-adenosylhomocysteine hydrolase